MWGGKPCQGCEAGSWRFCFREANLSSWCAPKKSNPLFISYTPSQGRRAKWTQWFGQSCFSRGWQWHNPFSAQSGTASRLEGACLWNSCFLFSTTCQQRDGADWKKWPAWHSFRQFVCFIRFLPPARSQWNSRAHAWCNRKSWLCGHHCWVA